MPAPTVDNVKRPRAFGFGCEINGRLFRFAPGLGSGVSIETAPTEAPRVDTASSPEEIVEDYGRVFARSAFDGGEGLFRAHTPDAEPNRYWDSVGVEVSPPAPGEFPELRLAKKMLRRLSRDMDRCRFITYRNTSAWILAWEAGGDSAYVLGANFPDMPELVTDFTPETIGSGDPFEDFLFLGGYFYAACGQSGILRSDNELSESWPEWSTIAATRLWGVKGRVVASDGRSLYELVDGATAPDPILTLEQGAEWTSVVDAGEVVLAAATNGYVYSLSSEDGALALIGETLFPGESVTSVGASRGVVMVGSSQVGSARLWVGSLSQAGTIASLQLIREWRDVSTSPLSIASAPSALYAAMPRDGAVDVWKLELQTLGLSRHRTIEAEGTSETIRFFEGHLYVAVDQSGVYRESDEYVDEGWLMGPLGDFFSASEKSWVGAQLETGELLGAEVDLFYTTSPEALRDASSTQWRRVLSLSTGTGAEEVPLSGVTSRQLAGMVWLRTNPGDGTSPTVRSFSFRAFASSGARDLLITLPINVSDQVSRRGRHRSRIKGLGASTYRDLRALEGRPALLRLYEPEETVRGLVESVGLPVDHPNGRRSVTTVALVRVRGRRTSGASSAVSTGTFGAFRFGRQSFGGRNG